MILLVRFHFFLNQVSNYYSVPSMCKLFNLSTTIMNVKIINNKKSKINITYFIYLFLYNIYIRLHLHGPHLATV